LFLATWTLLLATKLAFFQFGYVETSHFKSFHQQPTAFDEPELVMSVVSEPTLYPDAIFLSLERVGGAGEP
jgi:hypothetical protein